MLHYKHVVLYTSTYLHYLEESGEKVVNWEHKSQNKGVHLQGYFQEGDGAHEPDQKITCDGLLTDCVHLSLNLAFLQRIGREGYSADQEYQCQHCAENSCDYPHRQTSYNDRGLAMKAQNMDVNSLRHQAFIANRKTDHPTLGTRTGKCWRCFGICPC